MGIWVGADHVANSVGFGTHFNQAGTTYTSNNGLAPKPSVLATVNQLATIGVRHTRDTYDNTLYAGQSTFMYSVNLLSTTAPANSNVGFITVNHVISAGFATAVTNFGTSTTVGSRFYNWLNAGFPANGLPFAAETVNESDLNVPGYAGGPTTTGSVASLQQDFFTATGAVYPSCVRLAPSMGTPSNSAHVTGIASFVDKGNLHLYTYDGAVTATTGGGVSKVTSPTAGYQLWTGVAVPSAWTGTGCQICPGTQHWSTESGVPNYEVPMANGYANTSERSAAIFYITGWLFYTQILGGARMYCYEACDDHLNNVTTRESRFGALMRGDLSWKQGGQAFANVFALMYDPNASSLVLDQSITAALSGQLASTVWTIFCQYANGDCLIIMWQDVNPCASPGVGYGTSPNWHYPATPKTFNQSGVTVTFNRTFAGFEIYNPVDATSNTPVGYSGAGHMFTITPTEAPVFVKCVARANAGQVAFPAPGALLVPSAAPPLP